MPRKPRCKYCGRVVKHTSKSGLCPACQVRKVKKSVRDLKNKKGKYYKIWKQRIKEAILNLPL